MNATKPRIPATTVRSTQPYGVATVKESATTPAAAPKGADAATKAAFEARSQAQMKNDVAHQRRPAGAERWADGFEPGSSRPQLKAATREVVTRGGVPLFRQGDPDWGPQRIGLSDKAFGGYGCALTASAMALSKLTGNVVSPREVENHAFTNGGYAGNSPSLNWKSLDSVSQGEYRLNRQHPADFSIDRLKGELATDKPVVLGVDNDAVAGGADHWITLTEFDSDTNTFIAHDPASGTVVQLKAEGEELVEVSSEQGKALREKRKLYTTSGDFVTFDTRHPRRRGEDDECTRK